MRELQTAESAERRGDVEAALAAYRDAQTKCAAIDGKRRAKAACASAYLGEADALDHAGRTDAAIAAYTRIPAKLAADKEVGAIALYRAGRLAKDDALFWRVVTEYPDEPTAADALTELVTAHRAEVAPRIQQLLPTLLHTQVADNLMFALADLDAHELNDPHAALALYDRIPREYPDSGLRDDARWLGANLARQLGDAKGCADRLRGLLATREVAWMAGSYFSIWLDDAQLLLGQVLRDDLHDPEGAAAAFRQLPKDYPASTLKDDALYELSKTGDAHACAELKRQFPDSKYVERCQR